MCCQHPLIAFLLLVTGSAWLYGHVGWWRADDGYVNMYMSTSFNVHAAFVQDF